MTKIAVTGATGQLGRLAIAALRARGAEPIALVRSPEKAADMTIEARSFDYRAPDVAALAGVEVLVLISSNDFDDRAGQHRRVIQAAKEAGVGRLIYTSLLKGDASPMILARDHIETEAALRDSGLAVTILRNGWYVENFLGAIGAALQFGGTIGASGAGQVSAATRADFAEAIAVVATDAGHAGKIYELAGDQAFTQSELAAEIAAQSGRPVAFSNLTEADYAKALVGFGLPEGFAAILADSDRQAASGALFDDSGTLSQLIGRPTTPMAEAVRVALAAL